MYDRTSKTLLLLFLAITIFMLSGGLFIVTHKPEFISIQNNNITIFTLSILNQFGFEFLIISILLFVGLCGLFLVSKSQKSLIISLGLMVFIVVVFLLELMLSIKML